MVEAGDEKVEVPMIDVSQVALLGPVAVTTPTLHALMRAEVPVSWMSSGGWLLGHTVGTGSRNVAVREAQFRTAGRRTPPDGLLAGAGGGEDPEHADHAPAELAAGSAGGGAGPRSRKPAPGRGARASRAGRAATAGLRGRSGRDVLQPLRGDARSGRGTGPSGVRVCAADAAPADGPGERPALVRLFHADPNPAHRPRDGGTRSVHGPVTTVPDTAGRPSPST